MDNFLDTSVIIGYAQDEGKFVLFVKNKKENFVVCYFVLERDIPSLVKRMRIIINEVKNKLKDKNYEIQTKELYNQDLDRIKKFLSLKETQKYSDEKFIDFLDNFQSIFEFRIDFFIQKLIDQKVVPIKEIKFELKSSLFTYTKNHSDANILASGIQYHQENEIVLVTSDKQDWTKENLEWAIPEHSDLRKEYPKIPKIQYIQDL
jgi:hypothetical protein